MNEFWPVCLFVNNFYITSGTLLIIANQMRSKHFSEKMPNPELYITSNSSPWTMLLFLLHVFSRNKHWLPLKKQISLNTANVTIENKFCEREKKNPISFQAHEQNKRIKRRSNSSEISGTSLCLSVLFYGIIFAFVCDNSEVYYGFYIHFSLYPFMKSCLFQVVPAIRIVIHVLHTYKCVYTIHHLA